MRDEETFDQSFYFDFFFKQQAPKIPLLFSVTKVAGVMMSFYLGLLPFIPLKESFFEIPLPRVILR